MEAAGNKPDQNQLQSIVDSSKIKYAGFWIRVVASIIDSFVVGLLKFAITIIIFIVAVMLYRFFGIDAIKVKSAIVTLFPGRTLEMLVVGIYMIVTTKKYQATFGKKACGLQVVSVDGQKLTWSQVIIRETIGKIFSAVILGIGFLMAAFTEKSQTLHDKIAETMVIYKKEETK